MHATKERKVCRFNLLSASHNLTSPTCRYPCPVIFILLYYMYTVASSSPSYKALLSRSLHPQSALPHITVIIVQYWTRPWTFLEDLHTWLSWVERWVQGVGARELEVIREEHRERCVSVQHYTEPYHRPTPTLRHPVRCCRCRAPSPTRPGHVHAQCSCRAHRRVHQSRLDRQ